MLAAAEAVNAVQVDVHHPRLGRRFDELVEMCARFSQDLLREVGGDGGSTAFLDPVAANAEISRTVFGKWSLDILTFLYMRESAGFQELRRALGRISSRVLSSKLNRMQEAGLLRRDVNPSRPPRVSYSLTERGVTVAKLGEPVFLYLRLSAGLNGQDEPAP